MGKYAVYDSHERDYPFFVKFLQRVRKMDKRTW